LRRRSLLRAELPEHWAAPPPVLPPLVSGASRRPTSLVSEVSRRATSAGVLVQAAARPKRLAHWWPHVLLARLVARGLGATVAAERWVKLRQVLPLTVLLTPGCAPRLESLASVATAPRPAPGRALLGLSRPQSLLRALPQSLSQSLLRALPQSLSQSLLRALPQSLPQSSLRALPQSLPQSSLRALPQSLPQSSLQALPQQLAQPLPPQACSVPYWAQAPWAPRERSDLQPRRCRQLGSNRRDDWRPQIWRLRPELHFPPARRKPPGNLTRRPA